MRIRLAAASNFVRNGLTEASMDKKHGYSVGGWYIVRPLVFRGKLICCMASTRHYWKVDLRGGLSLQIMGEELLARA